MTQEPDFDESKTVLDTVLSSDLRETQLIREYELLLSHYDEASQARLEKIMAEMDSLNAWEIESQVKTVLSKLGLTDLNKTVAELSGVYVDECNWPKSSLAMLTCSCWMNRLTTWTLIPLSG